MSSLDNDVSDEEVLLLSLLIVKRRKRKRIWVNDTIVKRGELGEYHRLVQELKLNDQFFHTYFRMPRDVFGVLLGLVAPHICKLKTNYREPLCPEQRLAITLRYLATGDAFTTIAFSYRVGHSTVSMVVRETCEAIWKVLQPEVMPVPDRSHWLAVAQRFRERWNFTNCIGAIDGKHVRIQAPPNSGSLYFNYKKYFSIVLMAMVDADYKFVFVDIGNYGSSSDGGIFSKSKLGQGLKSGTLDIPEPTLLPDATEIGCMPYVAVADDAFPLKTYLMRPYPGRNLPEEKKIFNYRLSRARRISENAFGILVQKFRIYFRTINLMPENVEKVVKATCVLHNFLRNSAGPQEEDQNNSISCSDDVGAVQAIHNVAGNRPTDAAIRTRDLFKQYFTSPAGEVSWQYAMVRKGVC